ncbi:MAG: hypothetical protein IKE21_01240 [Erysipelotrichaceae bacterium]|nr:hypothetical protein [Erysipelotrichaceae bacterium]
MPKKICRIFLVCLLVLLSCGFADSSDWDDFDLEALFDYEKEFESTDVGVCSYSSTKTYEDYNMITSPSSRQYWYIRQYMSLDKSGLLVDKDGFFGVALGSYYGVIGDRYYITLDTGVVLPVVKIDEKADEDTVNGCYHASDGSVVEFVIDVETARNYFGRQTFSLYGDFNVLSYFNGSIEKVEKVGTELNEHRVTYEEKEETAFDNEDVFSYSGY